MKTLPILILVGVLLELCAGARILMVIPMPAKSHYLLGERLSEELVKKGHEVTLIAAFKRQTPFKNLTELVIPDMMEAFEKQMPKSKEADGRFSMRHMNPFTFLFFDMGEIVLELSLSSKPVQDLIKSNEKFDVIIGEAFMIEGLLAGLSYRFKAPIIGIATFMPNTWANELVGNPAPASYIPDPVLGFSDEMTFTERLINLVYTIVAQANHYLMHLPAQDKLMRKFFGSDMPNLKDIICKTSLVLVNHHYSLGFPRPLLPNMVEVGSYHIKPVKPLPKDIQKFMDEAEHGVVFFSMGSNLRSSEFPPEKFQGIIKVFSKLKQRVLWKFEADEFPNQPKNLKISKWLPQSDILAHPNLKVFVTHGGLLSTTEAVLRGVPVVGIPIFGDQPTNVKQIEKLQIGVSMQYDDIGKDVMYDKITEVLNNPKYAKNMKYRSQILQDLPMQPIDTAIYWIEYIIRHKGAPHLISGFQDLTWYQQYMLDVYAVFGLAFFIIFFCIRWIFRILCCRKSKKVSPQKKTN